MIHKIKLVTKCGCTRTLIGSEEPPLKTTGKTLIVGLEPSADPLSLPMRKFEFSGETDNHDGYPYANMSYTAWIYKEV